MVGWHHQLDGHEFEQAPGVGDRQGSLACCSPWDCKQSDTTQQLNNSTGKTQQRRMFSVAINRQKQILYHVRFTSFHLGTHSC